MLSICTTDSLFLAQHSASNDKVTSVSVLWLPFLWPLVCRVVFEVCGLGRGRVWLTQTSSSSSSSHVLICNVCPLVIAHLPTCLPVGPCLPCVPSFTPFSPQFFSFFFISIVHLLAQLLSASVVCLLACLPGWFPGFFCHCPCSLAFPSHLVCIVLWLLS